MPNPLCPQCDSELTAGDSGEPYYNPCWWCDECGVPFDDDELSDYDDDDDPEGEAVYEPAH